jgi:hypothetical protein
MEKLAIFTDVKKRPNRAREQDPKLITMLSHAQNISLGRGV